MYAIAVVLTDVSEFRVVIKEELYCCSEARRQVVRRFSSYPSHNEYRYDTGTISAWQYYNTHTTMHISGYFSSPVFRTLKLISSGEKLTSDAKSLSARLPPSILV